MRRVEALIVGGGPAGSAAAITLARGGVAAELIERSAGPRDVVCGGFLGWDALAALAALGIDAAALGARPIHRLRLVGSGRMVEADLPHPAVGLSRCCLDEALLAAAAAAGARVRRGIAARSAQGQVVQLAEGPVAATSLFLATGKHELRGLARPLPGRRNGAVGLRTRLPPSTSLTRALDGVIELHVFRGGYAGLLLQEDGGANLCLSVTPERLRHAGGIDPLLAALGDEAPRLGDRLADCGDAAWLSIGAVPYGWRARTSVAGLYRVGDQASVIASLAGDGVAIALRSGTAAAAAWLAGAGAPGFQRHWHDRAGRPLRVAGGLRWAAEARLPARLMMGLAGFAPSLAGAAARLTRIG